MEFSDLVTIVDRVMHKELRQIDPLLSRCRPEPRRFGDLKRDLKNVSEKILTQRLRELESLGVIDRRILPTSPPSVEYELTNIGKSFQPLIDEMIRVGKSLA
ncbi:MAG: helix-turn-helix domain-containing protein [Proteobacteria bacterium]|nr:helix-turn-helix domain-containing protein [Pseudomonadota bacterium]